MSVRSVPRPSWRRGDLTLELVAACALLATGVVLIAHFLVARNVARDRLALREAARVTAGNGLELLYALPWQELDSQQATQWVRQHLSGDDRIALDVDVQDEPGPPPGKRIRVQATIGADEQQQTITLSGWRYALPAGDSGGRP